MPVREVATAVTIRLGQGEFIARPWRDGFVIASPEPAAPVVAGDLCVLRRVALGGGIRDVALADDGVTLAWIDDGKLHISERSRREDAVESISGSGGAVCQWLPSGRALWVAYVTGDQVNVEIRERDLRVACRATVPDPFGESLLSLYEHPADDSVVLYVAAGQDGQESWLLSVEGAAIRAERLCGTYLGSPALFGPDGRWFVTSDDDRLALTSWPAGTELGALSWDSVAPQAGDEATDAPAVVLRLPGEYVAWSSMNGRIYIIDLITMSPADEIFIAGHPLNQDPAGNEEGLSTDLEDAYSGGNGAILTVHARETIALSAARNWSPNPNRRTARLQT